MLSNLNVNILGWWGKVNSLKLTKNKEAEMEGITFEFGKAKQVIPTKKKKKNRFRFII